MKYRISEKHTPRLGVIYTAEIKEHWWSSWRLLYDSDVGIFGSGSSIYMDTYDGQLKMIEDHKKKMKSKPEPIKIIYHTIK